MYVSALPPSNQADISFFSRGDVRMHNDRTADLGVVRMDAPSADVTTEPHSHYAI